MTGPALPFVHPNDTRTTPEDSGSIDLGLLVSFSAFHALALGKVLWIIRCQPFVANDGHWRERPARHFVLGEQ